MAATLGSSRQASARLRSTFAMRDKTFASRPGSANSRMARQTAAGLWSACVEAPSASPGD